MRNKPGVGAQGGRTRAGLLGGLGALSALALTLSASGLASGLAANAPGAPRAPDLLRSRAAAAVSRSVAPLMPVGARAGGAEALDALIPERGTLHPRLESALSQLAEAAQQREAGDGAAVQWRRFPDPDDRVLAVLETVGGVTPELARRLEALAAPVQRSYRHLVQVKAPVASLVALADLPGVRFVRRPLDLFPQAEDAVVGEGTRLVGSAPWLDLGFRGQGTRLAVVDLGFRGYQRLLGEELPKTVVTRSFVEDSTDIDFNTSHGTAVAELVADTAPDVDLYLVAVSTEVELGDAVDWLIAEGVHVVSFSVGALAGPNDGSGVLDEIVDRARAGGILWVNASGNYGKGHWQGTFTDTKGDGWHEFAGGSKLLPVTIGADEPALFLLLWDDWPVSKEDYGFYLFWEGVNGSLQLMGYSDSNQNGEQPPSEAVLSFFLPRGQYHLAIKKHKATGNARFNLFSVVQDLPQGIPAGSVVSPATARGALAVGATNGFEHLQAYSSQGPTGDGRLKPELVAPDTVTTASLGRQGFPGTSASTPYVSGAAALVRSAYPWFTAEDLQNYLQERALRFGDGLPNNRTGWGRLQLGVAPAGPPPVPTATATRTPTVAPSPSATATGSPVPTRTPTRTPTATATPASSPSPTATVAVPSPTGVAWPDHFSHLPIVPRQHPLAGE